MFAPWGPVRKCKIIYRIAESKEAAWKGHETLQPSWLPGKATSAMGSVLCGRERTTVARTSEYSVSACWSLSGWIWAAVLSCLLIREQCPEKLS
jgi:hypothetical protein